MADLTEAGSSTQEEEDEPVGPKQKGKGGKRRNIYLTDEQKEEVIEFLIRNEGLYNKKRELWQQPNKKKNYGSSKVVLWGSTGRTSTLGMRHKDGAWVV